MMHGPRPLIFGEVLYDVFPDGEATLGGAPFNVAWHLQGFGLAPCFVSRVGEDPAGERALAAMAAWGMDTGAVQRDARRPTGRVEVHCEGGDVRYDIVPEQAYDYIEPVIPTGFRDDSGGGLLYHGSLVARHPCARASLDTLRAAAASAFVDVNLRDPWWRRDWLEQALRAARWVKLNEHELAELLQRRLPDAAALRDGAAALRREYGIELLIVTRGARGALLVAPDALHEAAVPAVTGFVDAVGAGDAFSAVALYGLVRGWPLPLLAARAVEFAAAVCRQRGATRRDPLLYRQHLGKWEA